MSRKTPKSRARRSARSNPKPRAWSAKGPSRAYECTSPLLGRTVRLGRGEAVVESCATPSRRRPNQGQFRVRSKATGKSRAVPRRRVSAALYRAKHPRKMPAGLLTFWAKTREGGSARLSAAEAYGPRESLGTGAFEDARALPYGPLPSLGTGAMESLRPDARHLPRPSAYFGPGGAEVGRPRARSTKPKPETFAKARARIFDEFKALGWDVHTKNTARSGRPLKVPYVTSRDGRQRLDFHAESVYADGHSVESDFRGATARGLIDASARPNPSGACWRQNHHGGWHAPGDPLGYGPRANRTRKPRKRSR